MTELIPADSARYEQLSQVVELYVQNYNETQIAKRLNIKRKDVLAHIDEWRKSAVAFDFMKDRVHELIQSMDQHYTILIRKYYEIVEEVDSHHESTPQMLGQKKAALDSIGNLERQRIEVLQKSGLLDAADQGDELARLEEEKDLVLDILQHDLCARCHPHVMSRIAQLIKPTEGNVVVVKEE